MTKANKKYKDRLFRLIFSSRVELLALYNAVNDSHYTNPEELEITTLENVIYMGMKNDISFLLDDIENLYEHQSTYNPNMPLRGFLYLADLYRKYVEERNLDLYGRTTIKLPSPRYLIFYNGTEKMPDRLELKLSDAFMEKAVAEPCLEFKVLMFNINPGHNQNLMDKCRKLKEYAAFVSSVRAHLSNGVELGDAVDDAVEECIRGGILVEFLSRHRAEVRDVLLTEYNEQKQMELARKSARAEGRAEGKAEGKVEGKAEAVLLLLSDLGEVPEYLRNQIEGQKDGSVLAGWLRLAAKVQSIEEFVKSEGI